MALSKGAKIGLGVLGGLGVLAIIGGAAANESPVIVTPPPDPVTPPPDPIVEPPPPPPKPGAKKNYVGSGWNWPQRQRFPTVQSFIVFLNTYGYPANAQQNITSLANRIAIRKFQQQFNVVRAAMAKQGPVALGAIGEDGLIGVGTINAMRQAEVWVNQRSTPWQGLVQQAQAA